MSKRKPLQIDMVAGSQLRDSQGEMLSVEGADISELEAGRGRFNDNHGKGHFNCIGRVTGAKKILKADDCDNDRQKYYWEKIKAAYIYVKGELFDDEDHPNARAAAAIMRNIHKNDSPLKMKASVEGGVVARGINDESLLARTKIHSIALTFTPANQATLVEPVSLNKSIDPAQEAADMKLIKSVEHLAIKDVPSFRQIERRASAEKIKDNLEQIQILSDKLGLEKNLPDIQPERFAKQALKSKIMDNMHRIHNFVFKLKKNSDKYKNWRHLTEKEIGEEYEREYDKTGDFHGAFPTLDSFKHAIKHASYPQKITKDFDLDNIDNRSHTSSIDELKDLTSQYKFPRDVDRITRGFDENAKMPYPIVLKRGDDYRVMSGNTRMDAAHIKGNEPHALIIDVDHHNKNMSNPLEKPKTITPPDIAEPIVDAPHKEDKINKALTAGMGGAGAPTSLTGGGVLQGESFRKPPLPSMTTDYKDKKKKKKKKKKLEKREFDYITCDKCGKEQVVMRHQVKCRNCGTSFSLEKLKKLIKSRF